MITSRRKIPVRDWDEYDGRTES